MSVLLASLALLASGQQADLSRKINFESVAMPAKRLVAEFGKQAGLSLDTSAQTAGEILVVRFADLPIQEALDKIAIAVDGEWKQEGEVKRLIRPTANLNRELAAERADKAQAIQKEIKDQVAALNKKPAATQGAPEIPTPFGLGAENKEVLQLLTRLNPADLVLADSDSRVVFSSSPTRVQKLLPGNLEAIVTSLVTEHNKAAAARKEGETNLPDDEALKGWIELMKSFGFDDDPKPIEGRPAKLLLVIEQPNFIGGVQASLRIYDAKGQVALQKQGNLGMSRFMEEAMEMAKPKPAGAPPQGEDKPIEFSTETAELGKLFQSMNMMPTNAKLSASLEAKLSRPDLYDPLSFSTSESLLAVAKAKNLNLVANVPDSMSSLLDMFTGGKATVNSFLTSLESLEVVKVEKPGGWLVVTPKWPADARKKRFDRLALTRLIDAAKKNGTVGLDDLAAYALTSPSPMDESASMSSLMLFAPGALWGMNGMLDWNALKFYGSLDLNQRRVLGDGGRIPFAGLSSLQRDLATRMLYSPQAGLKLQTGPEKAREERGFMEMIGGFMGGQPKDYRQEPTEIMPNGIPANGYVTAQIDREPIGIALESGSLFAHAPFGAEELAMFRYFKEDPNLSMVGGMMPQISKLRMGERTNVSLKFFVAQDVVANKELQDNRVPTSGAIVSMDNLPADFSARIEKRVQAFKKTPFPAFGTGGGVRPPQ